MEISTHPKYAEGLNYIKENKFEEAELCFTEVLKTDSEHFNSLYNRAVVYTRLQKFDLSITDWHTLLVQDPHNANVHGELAVALHLKGENEKALKHFTTAVKIEPENPFRYSSRAFVKERTKDLKGALVDYERAIELDPKDAISLNNKGLIEEKLGRKDKAKQSFAQADKIDQPKREKADLLEKNKNKKKHKLKTPENHQAKKDLTVESATHQDTEQAPLTVSFFLKTLKEVLFSKEIRKEFVTFVSQLCGTKEKS